MQYGSSSLICAVKNLIIINIKHVETNFKSRQQHELHMFRLWHTRHEVQTKRADSFLILLVIGTTSRELYLWLPCIESQSRT